MVGSSADVAKCRYDELIIRSNVPLIFYYFNIRSLNGRHKPKYLLVKNLCRFFCD